MKMRRNRDQEQGQVIVLFALMFIVATAMVGLILDGGATFAVRRDAQSAADLAALSGANEYLVEVDAEGAIARARDSASANGFTDGVNGDTVAISLATTPTLAITVDITTHHQNAFARVIPGQEVWAVSVTATASAGVPDSAATAVPMMFSYRVFNADGTIRPEYTEDGCPTNGCPFGDANGDVPTSADDIAWTDYSYDDVCVDNGNVDADTAKDIARSNIEIDVTLPAGCYIGQHNNGNMTTVYDEVRQYLMGHDYPVPVVDDTGHFQGWATFHVSGATGGSDKHVYGYFKGPFKNSDMSVKACSGNSCPAYLGSYVLKLTH